MKRILAALTYLTNLIIAKYNYAMLPGPDKKTARQRIASIDQATERAEQSEKIIRTQPIQRVVEEMLDRGNESLTIIDKNLINYMTYY